MSVDYCDLCDLPLATCVHGMPPAPKEPVKAPRRASKPAVRRTAVAGVPTRQVTRRWTAPDDLKPHILAVLDEAGGELDQGDVFAALETRLDESLLAGDRERTPEGELRWQYAARRARQALVSEGLMSKGRPGVWSLSS